MNKFSERIGITNPPIIQLNSITATLRNSLWNIILVTLEGYTVTALLEFCRHASILFFKIPADEVRTYWSGYELKNWLKGNFYKLSWYDVYNFIEFLIKTDKNFAQKASWFNNFLEEENSGYRLIKDQIVPITNTQEIQAIEEASKKAEQFGIEGARAHISQAQTLFAKRPDPDYRNSIKESISAVESLVTILSGKNKCDFAPILEELSKKIPLHGALKEGFKKLYGYTSDEDGIRHAILEDPNVGYDEAKFMLVSCSAFINFLLSKGQKTGLLKEG